MLRMMPPSYELYLWSVCLVRSLAQFGLKTLQLTGCLPASHFLKTCQQTAFPEDSGVKA